MTVVVVVDFDGTITRQDATDLILGRFALPEWRTVEADWTAGRIGSRACLARQIDLLRATGKELDDLIASFEIDPAFPAFTRLCRDLGFEIKVASDGFDRVIRAVLGRTSLDLPFTCNRLVQTDENRWRLEFPHFDESCEVASGMCKCALFRGATSMSLFVGDGRSDFCVAGRANLVFAKEELARYCQDNGIAHVAISGFADAITAMREVSLRRSAAPTLMAGVAEAGPGGD